MKTASIITLFYNPQEEANRMSRLDLVLWSDKQQQILAFTLPWEYTVDCKRKMLRCTGSAAKGERCGWKDRLRPWMLRGSQ